MPMTAEMEEMSKPKLTNSPRRRPHAPLAAAPKLIIVGASKLGRELTTPLWTNESFWSQQLIQHRISMAG